MVFIADDLGAWLVALLADAGRKKLTTVLLGNDQERALRHAATAAVQQTATEMRQGANEQAQDLALVISQVFSEPMSDAPLAEHQTILEALQSGIAAQLAVLADASLTGTGQSSADLLEVPSELLAKKLTGHLLREIVVRGSRGGPLEPLAAQLNHDLTHLQGQQIHDAVRQMGTELRESLDRLGGAQAAATDPIALERQEPPGRHKVAPPRPGRETTPAIADSEVVPGHAFISYAREDSHQVDQLQQALENAGIRVWRDTASLWPGEDWRTEIRRAITDNALVFIACFSRASLARDKSYQNEELTLAIEQLRQRRPDDRWLIPVRLDECDIPDRDIGGGRTLNSIHRADLFGDRFDESAARLITAIQQILGRGTAAAPAGPAQQMPDKTKQPGRLPTDEGATPRAIPADADNPVTSFEPGTALEAKVNGLAWPRERIARGYARHVREHGPGPFEDEAALLEEFERTQEEKKQARDQLMLELEATNGPPPDWFAEFREWNYDTYSKIAEPEGLFPNWWDWQQTGYVFKSGFESARPWLQFPHLVFEKGIAPGPRPGIPQDDLDPTLPFRDWWEARQYSYYRLSEWAEDFRVQRLDQVPEELQARQDAALVYASTADAGNGLKIATWSARAAIEMLAIAMDAAVALNYWNPSVKGTPSDLSSVSMGIVEMGDLDTRIPPEDAADVAPLVRATCAELVEVQLTAHRERAVKSLGDKTPKAWLSYQRWLTGPLGRTMGIWGFRNSVAELVLAATKAVNAIHLPDVNLRRPS